MCARRQEVHGWIQTKEAAVHCQRSKPIGYKASPRKTENLLGLIQHTNADAAPVEIPLGSVYKYTQTLFVTWPLEFEPTNVCVT